MGESHSLAPNGDLASSLGRALKSNQQSPDLHDVGNFAWRFSGRLAMYVHGRRSPEPEAWSAMIGEMRARRRFENFRVLVYSEGGMPNASQRQTLFEILGGSQTPTALLTRSPFSRFVGWLIGLFNHGFRCFGRLGFEKACAYLQLQSKERAFAEKVLIELAMSVDLSWRPNVSAPARTGE